MTRIPSLVMRKWGNTLPTAFRQLAGQVRSSPLASRFARGSIWSLAGSVISRALGLISAIVAARILGKASYGELGMIQSTVGMFGAIAGFGMGMTATKFVAEFRMKDPAKAGRIIALSSAVSWGTSSVLALTLVLISSWLCRRTLEAPHLTSSLQISALLLLLGGVNGAQNGVLAGFEAFKRLATVNTLAGLLNFPLVVGGAFLFGLPGIIWGLILAQAVGCILNFYAVRCEATRHHVPISYSSWKSEASVIWRFSIPAVLGGLLITPVTWACSAILVRQPHGYDHMGTFNAANQWFNAMMWLPYMLGGVILPMLAESFSANDRTRSAKLLSASIKINAAICFPLILIVCLFSPLVMNAYGPDFRAEWPTLVATLLTAGILALQIPVAEVIAASGRMWMGFLMNLGWSIAFLVATWLLTGWGAFGLATARLLAYAIHAIWTFAFAMRVMRKADN